MSVGRRFQGLGADGPVSLFDISLEAANSLYTWGWRGSIFGAVITALAVGSLMWGTKVRDHDFETRMTELNVVAGQARERASAADERAATLEKEAAAARLKLAQITLPRWLTPEQVEKLKPLLVAIPNKGKVVVKGRWPDEEALSFTKQISELMSDAGFDIVETPSAQHVLSIGNVGVNIVVRDIDDAPPSATPVQAAFKDVGLETPGISDPKHVPEADVFWIMIGSRY
jgi:hypothetical protein